MLPFFEGSGFRVCPLEALAEQQKAAEEAEEAKLKAASELGSRGFDSYRYIIRYIGVEPVTPYGSLRLHIASIA